MVTFVAPVSAALIGVFLFDEEICTRHIQGMALILGGLVAIDGRVWRLLQALRAQAPQATVLGAPLR